MLPSSGKTIIARNAALKIAVIYALFSVVWILFSDQILFSLVSNLTLLTTIQTVKGWFFISITAYIIYSLLHREIVAAKESEDRLKKSEEKYRLMSERTGLLVYDYDLESGSINWSGSIKGVTGYLKDEFRNIDINKWEQSIHEEDRQEAIDLLEKVMDEGGQYNLDYRFQQKDGSYIHVNDTGTFLRDNIGDIYRMLGSMKDISKNVKLEEQLRQAQKMEAVGTLAGGVAHNFNNMLAGILGAAELLQLTFNQNDQAKKLTNMILESGERASSLTHQLLTFAGKQQSASPAIDLHYVIRESIGLLENTIDRGVKIEVNLNADSSIIIGDSSQLQTVLINLGINAWHAMPDGGVFSIFTQQVELDEHYCEQNQFELIPGEYLKVEIKDTGSGIVPKNIPRIFEPFFTTKKGGKGTGLGLATVYGIIQQHKGEISISSKVGKGTVFQLHLPLTKEHTVNYATSEARIQGSGCILVIDDEQVIRDTSKSILESLGYTALTAENGKEGIRVFMENQSMIDLVLLDMIMPEMNGKDCFKALKKIDPNVRGILSSGFSQEHDIEELKAVGIKTFIHKPFRSALLSKVIHEALSQ